MILRAFKQSIPGMVLLYLHAGMAQDRATPLIRNFTPRETQGGKENWDIAQDLDGVMYFANKEGVLIHDGETWELVPLAGRSMCRGLTVDDHGVVYVGGVHEFGYLLRDGFGPCHYVSLSKDLDLYFGNVWQIYATDHGVYFQSAHYLFKWWNGELTTLPFESKKGVDLDASTVVLLGGDDSLWLLEATGLRQLPNSRVEGVIADRVQLLRDHNGDLLVINGLFDAARYEVAALKVAGSDPVAFSKLDLCPATRQYLAENELYTAKSLDSGVLALGTVHGGVLICDAKGGFQFTLNRETGLSRDRAQDLFCDANSDLWIAMSNGLALAEFNSPLSQYDGEPDGFQDPICFQRQNGLLYMGASNGLFILKAGDRFELLKKERNGVRDLFLFKNHLLMASDKIYLIQGEGFKALSLPYSQLGNKLYTMGRSRRFENRLFLGSRNGLFCLTFTSDVGENSFMESGQVQSYPEISDRVLAITEDSDGNLWLQTRSEGLFHLVFDGEAPQNYRVVSYSDALSLPEDAGIAKLRDGVRLISDTGVYRTCRHEADGRLSFSPDEDFMAHYGKGMIVHQLHQQEPGAIWAATSEGIGVFERRESGLDWVGSPLQRLGSGSFFPDEREQVWANTPAGLFRYHPQGFSKAKTPFTTLIRRVEINGEAVAWKEPKPYDLQNKTLSFSFAAAAFQAVGQTQYRFKLHGLDSEWSHWGRETRVSYNNLSGGPYQFMVQARNAHGAISAASHAFAAPRPLGRFVLIGVGFLALLIGAIRLHSLYLKRKHRLEQRAVLAGAERQKMEALGRLASGIAHDFNRVLAAIFGFSSLMKEDASHHPVLVSHLSEIERAGESGRDLVEQILNFSRRDKRGFEPVNLSELLENALSLAAVAFPPGVRFTRDIPSDPVWVNGNKSRLQQAVLNLCQNAVQALAANPGEVLVRLETRDGKAFLLVQDSGEGMSPQVRARIFEPFFTTRPEEEGTGLGLALIHGIVSEMDGQIKVKSRPGEGSQFQIIFNLPPIPAATLAPVQNGPGQRILLIDDRQGQLKSKVLLLRSAGYKVSGMGRDEFPLDTLSQSPERFDLVILAGRCFTQADERLFCEMRNIEPNLPVLLCLEESTGLDPSFDQILTGSMDNEAYLKAVSERLSTLKPTPTEAC